MAARREEEIQIMDKELLQERRGFLKQFGATLGAAGLGAAGVGTAHAAAKPKGNIPDRLVKVGHTTFLTGPAELLGGPGQRGHVLAQEEINAQGGLLGKRKIETIFADEAAGTDGNVKELRRMKLSENIELFTGVISSGNTPALGPVAEELRRSEEHTSELQSQSNLVCRLLLEKKKNKDDQTETRTRRTHQA